VIEVDAVVAALDAYGLTKEDFMENMRELQFVLEGDKVLTGTEACLQCCVRCELLLRCRLAAKVVMCISGITTHSFCCVPQHSFRTMVFVTERLPLHRFYRPLRRAGRQGEDSAHQGVQQVGYACDIVLCGGSSSAALLTPIVVFVRSVHLSYVEYCQKRIMSIN
jgi:hypothetical protein